MRDRWFESGSLQRRVSNEPSADDLPEARPTSPRRFRDDPRRTFLREQLARFRGGEDGLGFAILEAGGEMTVATVRPDGYPQANTVNYVSDGLVIYFGCAAESQKVRNIGCNDKVSLTVTPP
jgi:hypothetical protein